MLGPEGHVLELIPSDPNERFVCEPLPKSSDAGKTLSRRDFVDWSRPAVRVAVGEAFVIAFFDTASFDGVERHTNHAVWARDFTSIITEDWPGTHTFARVAFEDGPKALRAAIECLEHLSSA